MNFMLFLPEFLLAGLAFGVLGIDLFLPRERKIYLPWITLVGLVGVLVVSLTYMWGRDTDLYDGLFLVDNFSLFFKGFFLVLGALVVLMSVDYVKKNLSHPGEYYGILLFSILGMMLMTAAGELLTAYISLELLSFSLYVLVSHGKNNPKSNEAGIKYILLGAFASALLLYGISQVYGMLGTTRFSEIHAVLAFEPSPLNPALLVGTGAHCGRAGIQGGRRALPHVGPRRLRRRSHADNCVPGRGVKGRRLRPDTTAVFPGLPSGHRRLADYPGGAGRSDHDCGQPGGPGPGQHQENAGLLQRGSRGDTCSWAWRPSRPWRPTGLSFTWPGMA